MWSLAKYRFLKHPLHGILHKALLADLEKELAKAPQVQTVRWYTVQADDTLTKIATRMLGNPQAWKQVFELNQDTISNPHLVRAGAKIRIPASSAMAVGQGTSP